MGLAEALAEIATTAQGLLAGSTLLTDPGVARVGTQATVAVYRAAVNGYRRARLHHVLVTFQTPQSAPYTRPEQIDQVSNAANGVLDYLQSAQPGGMLVHWPTGVSVTMEYEDGALARIDIPLCEPEEYARIG